MQQEVSKSEASSFYIRVLAQATPAPLEPLAMMATLARPALRGPQVPSPSCNTLFKLKGRIQAAGCHASMPWNPSHDCCSDCLLALHILHLSTNDGTALQVAQQATHHTDCESHALQSGSMRFIALRRECWFYNNADACLFA